MSKAQRSVTYNDYHAPQFTLDGPLQYALGADDVLDNIGATDQLDGNLSASAPKSQISTAFPNDTEGEYPLEFTVTNSAGDVYAPDSDRHHAVAVGLQFQRKDWSEQLSDIH